MRKSEIKYTIARFAYEEVKLPQTERLDVAIDYLRHTDEFVGLVKECHGDAIVVVRFEFPDRVELVEVLAEFVAPAVEVSDKAQLVKTYPASKWTIEVWEAKGLYYVCEPGDDVVFDRHSGYFTMGEAEEAVRDLFADCDEEMAA